MRGKADTQMTMLSLVTADQLVPEDHPIRQIKPIVNEALHELSPVFNRMYAETGWPSIPPEHLLKACLLIALYSVRSERQFCERLQSQSGDTRRPCDYGVNYPPAELRGIQWDFL
ncbi:MAG: transposase [Dehalococcoidia bacterium]|nr:transposase [Dehalococcoidia bacterium]